MTEEVQQRTFSLPLPNSADGTPQRWQIPLLKGVWGGIVLGLIILALCTAVVLSLYFADWENKFHNEGYVRIVLSSLIGAVLFYYIAKGLYMSLMETYSRLLLAHSSDACFWFWGRGNHWWQVILRIISLPIMGVLHILTQISLILETSGEATRTSFFDAYIQAKPCTIALEGMKTGKGPPTVQSNDPGVSANVKDPNGVIATGRTFDLDTRESDV